MKNWYVYIVECNDGSLYTGCTDNLLRRIEVHNKGNGAKYTRSRLPVTLVYSEQHQTHSLALKREIRIKRLNRNKKIQLIDSLSKKVTI